MLVVVPKPSIRDRQVGVVVVVMMMMMLMMMIGDDDALLGRGLHPPVHLLRRRVPRPLHRELGVPLRDRKQLLAGALPLSSHLLPRTYTLAPRETSTLGSQAHARDTPRAH